MSFEKLRILLWKNWVLQMRRPIAGFFQILFPILIVVLFAWFRNSMGNLYNAFGRQSEIEHNFNDFSACVSLDRGELQKVFFAPNSAGYTTLIETTFANFEVQGFENEGVLLAALSETTAQTGIFIFQDESQVTTDQLPKKIVHYVQNKDYSENCTLKLQHELERGIIASFAPTATLKNIIARNFPYEDQVAQIFTQVMMFMLPMFLVFSMFATVSAVIKSVASERETRMKELMKIMGLSSALNWSSWFIKCLLMSAIAYTIVTVFLCVPIFGSGAIFKHSSFFLIWLFFIFYCIGVITFCFMVSTMFTKASVATNVGVMLFFSTYVPYYVYGTQFENLNGFVQWLFCLPINTALGQGMAMALNQEVNRQGVTFANILTQVKGFQFSFLEILIVMLIASVIHLLIMAYLEMVFPGDVGVPKPWHFPFTFCFKRDKTHAKSFVENGEVSYASDDLQEEPKHLNAKVRIVNLSKSFGSFRAVNSLSLNIYEDQITVLLAHNGGGKTTTMNMLTGMLPPTSGTAFINDFDITTNIDDARKSLAICPQHNILFADLTVREHIIFFCRLKGMKNSKKIDAEVEKYVKMMDFVDKKNARSKTLSGGQQRKLSIANALCGGSTFVVLDEPTSGLDIKARRNLWDLLIEEKKGRTILLSTHYMDEADVLGDRIAIMNEGQLKTVGTSFFLKKKFGSGYRLIVVKRNGCDASEILRVIREFAPDAGIESDEQLEAVFILAEEYLDKFDQIFKRLEDESAELGIESFGCSLTTLEEVFLKVGVETNERLPNGHETVVSFNDLLCFTKVPPLKLYANQIYAMTLKKIHFTKRNYSSYILLAILTAWLTFVFLAAPMTFDAGFFDMSLRGLAQTDQKDSDFIQNYRSLFEEGNLEITELGVFDFIYRHFMRFNRKFQIGLSHLQGESTSTVYFAEFIWNAPQVALNYYHRAQLQTLAGRDHDIRMRDDPFRRREEQTPPPSTDDDRSVNENFNESRNIWEDITVYILFFFLLIYWPSIHINMKIKERMLKAKLLQFISGASRLLYSLTSFVLDTLIVLTIIYFVYGIIAAIGRPGFNTAEEAAMYLLIFFFYVINVIPFIYLISFIFKKHSAGESMTPLILVVFAALYIAYAILHNTFYLNSVTTTIGKIIYWFAIFFAPFSLVDCFVKIMTVALFSGELWEFGDDGLYLNFVLLTVGGVIFMTFVLLIDFNVFMKIRYKLFNRSPPLPPSTAPMDDDVMNEVARVKNKTPAQVVESNLVLSGLSKFYGKNCAVNNLFMGIEKAECFGLLGVNGSGKTSVFKMLTGDEIISAGNAWIHGHSLVNDLSKIYEEIGYCPQYDALLPDLSGRETLKIFCLLRGIPNDEINGVIESFAIELDFYKHLDKRVGDFSGGNKRKLSTALSLLGNLSLIFLDECSSGIDAKAKRQLWNIISITKNAGKSIVLTSHSMQECEALCTKLAIMVDGEFQCLGSIQHLKNKFSKGFILKIMMARKDDEEHFEAIQQRVRLSFPHVQLKERFMGLLTFHIDIPQLKWSEVFAELATMKEELGINDYTMTQSSLESVFLFFSQRGKQKDE